MSKDIQTVHYAGDRHCHTLPDNSTVEVVDTSSVAYGAVNSTFLNPNGTMDVVYNAILDYSTTPVELCAGPPSGKAWLLKKVAVHVKSAGVPGTLANGVRAYIKRNDVEVNDLLAGYEVKSRFAWAIFSDTFLDVSNNEGKHVNAHIFFEGVGGIRIEDTDTFCILLQDDLTSLSEHYFVLTFVEV